MKLAYSRQLPLNPVWRDTALHAPLTLHYCRRERRVTGRFALLQFAPLDVFSVSSTFPAYSVKTQALFWRGARDARGAVFRETPS